MYLGSLRLAEGEAIEDVGLSVSETCLSLLWTDVILIWTYWRPSVEKQSGGHL